MMHNTIFLTSLTKRCGKVLSFSPGLFVVLFLTGVLAGCSSPVLIQEEQPDVSSSPYGQRQDALGTLLNQAWNAREAGRFDEAESALGRAMRISPTAPDVYYQLALLRRDQGRFAQSRQLAERALSLKPGFMLERKINHLLSALNS
ncbi:tetratricopeptide repeat protein [Endozoicomonas sp. SCSIO W0465]|uniref:tetratricopeptide repeat protein n=1 Tax=Endozoicomonas sp. SCSIO W0465 TaxID=2918516 RepID=UPI002075804F|nr:tetratricopeptide repeat protein [Endozoicomonas sp. SCSIO W0465]USE36311.1 tetratricopeptide repeat protein [Endozoicomonas sp. SCSIO W0465]